MLFWMVAKNLNAESMLHEPYADHASRSSLAKQRQYSKPNDSQEIADSSIAEETVANGDDRASFLQTAQRLFSFLNRFSSDENHEDGDFRLPDFHAPTGRVNESKSDVVLGRANVPREKNGANSRNLQQPPRKSQFNYKAFKEKDKEPARRKPSKQSSILWSNSRGTLARDQNVCPEERRVSGHASSSTKFKDLCLLMNYGATMTRMSGIIRARVWKNLSQASSTSTSFALVRRIGFVISNCMIASARFRS